MTASLFCFYVHGYSEEEWHRIRREPGAENREMKSVSKRKWRVLEDTGKKRQPAMCRCKFSEYGAEEQRRNRLP